MNRSVNQQIKQQIDRQHLLMAYPECVMCGNPSVEIAFETQEGLCFRCARNNDEARRRK